MRRLLSRDVLVREVDDRILSLFYEQVSLWQAVLFLAGLEVGEARVLAFVKCWVEVFELAFTLVEVPELLLGATTDQQLLILEVLLICLLLFVPKHFRALV